MATAICDALGSTDARVVLLSSTGDASSAPAPTCRDGRSGEHRRGGVRRVAEAMRACAAPVVVRVQGLCLAGGVGLMLGADIAVAADERGVRAARDRPRAVAVHGERPAGQHVSPKVAMDLMLTGRGWLAEALSIGLLSRVVPATGLDPEVEVWWRSIALLAPLAVRKGSRLSSAPGRRHARRRHGGAAHALSHSEDAAEGIAAFREQREPAGPAAEAQPP